MRQLDAGAGIPLSRGGQLHSDLDRLRSAAPRIVETWIERVMNRGVAGGSRDQAWVTAFRAFGISTLDQVAIRQRGARMRPSENTDIMIGRMVAAARRSSAPMWQVVDDLMLLVPATLSELPSERGTGPRGDMVCDQIRSAVMSVAHGLGMMAARMERERSETIDARTEMHLHELHNRFGAADTASRLLTRRSPPSNDPDWLQRVAALIQSAIDEGLRTVEAMRPRTPDSWPVSLPALIHHVVQAHDSMAADREIDLSACGSLPEVHVDGLPVRMILSNLIRNALIHHDRAKAGRTVVVSGSQPDSRRVAVTVRDNGPGIRKGRLEEIFLPGVQRQAAAETVRAEGLGLAVVREALDQMGGGIDVASDRGKGTTFRVTVPWVVTEPAGLEMGIAR